MKVNWDVFGIGTSVACAIHCAVLPIVVSSLPVFGINIVHNPYFEWSMISIALFVGTYALVHGYRTHHQSFTPLLIFGAGFIFLVLKQFFPQLEYLFLALAVILIISAHFYNYRFCQRSKCASPHHKH